MNWTDRRVAVAAVVLLVATMPVVAQVGAVRDASGPDGQRGQVVAPTVADRQAPNDYDGDGVPDARDACPRRPETNNGVQDDDGCPDVVATTGAS